LEEEEEEEQRNRPKAICRSTFSRGDIIIIIRIKIRNRIKTISRPNSVLGDLRGLEPDVFEFSAQLQIHYVFSDVTIRCVHNASTICVIFPERIASASLSNTALW
jgi:hypothetical protein